MPLRWHCSCLKCFTALLILAAQASHLVCRALVRRVTLLACLRITQYLREQFIAALASLGRACT